MTPIESPTEDARTKRIFFVVTATIAGLLLAYGTIGVRPPILFLLFSALSGFLFISIHTWGKRRNCYGLAFFIAWPFLFIMRLLSSEFFFGGKPDPFWTISTAQMGAYLLGMLTALPSLTRANKAARSK